MTIAAASIHIEFFKTSIPPNRDTTPANAGGTSFVPMTLSIAKDSICGIIIENSVPRRLATMPTTNKNTLPFSKYPSVPALV